MTVVMTQPEVAMLASEEFVGRTEPFRRELLAHCYRMLGSAHDAEDLVQDTYLRSWRARTTFESRSSVRTWLYQIATNACLTALRNKSRRQLPSGLGGPADDSDAPIIVAGPDVAWLQPMPDALVNPESDDPAAVVSSRNSLRLALIASMQYLPPRQRAVLILRDVLAFPAAQVAEMLDTTTAAVKSTLQRARARMKQVAPTDEEVTEPTDPAVRALLEQYIAAFENADATAIERLLCQDATLEMTPCTTWFDGRRTCLPYITTYALGSVGDWLMVPTGANGQPAAAAYRRDTDGVHRAFAIAVLTMTMTGIKRIVLFGGSDLFATFGLPESQLIPTTAGAP